MQFIIVFILIILIVMFPHLRNILCHPIQTLINAPVDFYKYIRYKKWRECKSYGTIDMYCSDTSKVFGNGKTLSGTHYVRNIYNKYNDKLIYDSDEKEWISQKIIILSNVHLKDVPYTHLTDVQQILDMHDVLKSGEIMLVYIDECGVIFNSRNFKDNIGQDLLNSMLTCRKKKFGMFLTAQRFNQVDALIRQLTSKVFMCEKFWRSVVLRVYNGFDMEYCTNVSYLKATTISYFATNKLFASYDTNQGVEDIKKKQKNKEMLSYDEILSSQGASPDRVLNVRTGNRKLQKIIKRS